MEPLEVLKSLHKSHRNDIREYQRATNDLPIEKHRNNLAFLQIWLEFIDLAAQNDYLCDEIRTFYKYLKSSNAGNGAFQLFWNWARYEQSIGNIDKAKNILQKIDSSFAETAIAFIENEELIPVFKRFIHRWLNLIYCQMKPTQIKIS